ncbi:MAG: T9SS type A sorting domain-containing protein [Lachnospiraceae bacterium]
MASPKAGGSVNPGDSQVAVGQSVSCYANEKRYYDFVHWLRNGEVVSTESYYTFTMPDEDVEMTAVFELNYDPQNPEDPQEAKPSHRVTLTASPGQGGRFNMSVFRLEEGETTYIYAYPYEDYRFVSWKKDGELISTSNPYEITMGEHDLSYSATFVYDPQSPSNPGANSFNILTGNLIIDDFKTGYLSNAISQSVGGSENYSDIKSVTIIGSMNSTDYGFCYGMDYCEEIDLARTSGYNMIPSYAFVGLEKLEKLSLPSCLEEIGENVFNGCHDLMQISIYAVVPPKINSRSFNGLNDNIIIRVPTSSMSLYEANEYWNNYTILPLNEELCSLSVSLPSDASDGRYKDMTLELTNMSNGQNIKYLITNRTTYTFPNLVLDSKYYVSVKNSYGAVLGMISDIETSLENHNIVFQSLKQPKDVLIQVLTPVGEDVTDNVQISWFDETDAYLAQGSKLRGMIEGNSVKYQISLPSELALKFQIPDKCDYIINNDESIIKHNLNSLTTHEIFGVVKNRSNNDVISNATVTITQTLNGKHTKSHTVKTDSSGKYSTTIFDAPTSIVIAHDNYVSQSIEMADLSNISSMPDVLLKELNGTTINIELTYRQSALGGEGTIEDHYSDIANVSYHIVNKTTNREVVTFNVKYPDIIAYDGVSIGDEVVVTVSSKKQVFKDVSANGFINSSNHLNLNFPIVQFGGISATYLHSDNEKNVGILYDSKGLLVQKADYVDGRLEIANVLDGDYTFVSLGSSQYFSSIQRLSDLESSGLIPDTDYVKQNVSISSGIIENITVEDIPAFNESQYYYTGEKTSFTTNKPSITVGNYITLRANVDFKEQFKASVQDVNLIFDLPNNCELINNSILCGNGLGNFSIEGNKIIIPLTNTNDFVRFCITPLESGTYKPTAFVQFSLNGKRILQPIGVANFSAERIKLITPNGSVSNETITVSGYAPTDSKVFLYNKNELVGQTMPFSNGKWSIPCNISNGKKYRSNLLYARIQLKDGQYIETETKQVVYNEKAMRVKNVTLVNGSNTVVFDFIDNTRKNLSYSFNPSNSNFIFKVNFDDNANESLENVWVNITTSNGELVELPAYYSSSNNIWVASSKDFDSKSLPVKCSVSYDYFDLSLINDKDLCDDFVEDLYSDIEVNNIITDNNFPSLFVVEYFDNKIGKTDYFTICKDKTSKLQWLENRLINNGWERGNESGEFRHYVLKSNWASISLKNDSISCISNCNLINVLNDNIAQTNVSFKSPISRATYVDPYQGYRVLGENIFDRGFRRRMGGVYDKVNCILSCERTDDGVRYTIAQYARDLWYLNAASLQAALTGIGELGLAFAPGDHTIETLVHGTQAAYDQRTVVESIMGYREQEAQRIIAIMSTRSDCKCPDTQPRNITRRLLSKSSMPPAKCKKGENEDESDDKLTPTIDPSGYVYEAVPSNRLEGVTATVFYKEYIEDMYGDLHEQVVKWNAEEYAQSNPLFTDDNGAYAWDVPQGLWQVKFEKNGYETTYSDWLPVPPPQLDVNVGMVQLRQPEISSVHAYPDGVELQFDKYMNPFTLTTENIIVMVDDKPVSGEIIMLNEESVLNGEQSYVSKIRFVANSPFAKNEVSLTVTNRVQSYAGVRMASNYSQVFDVEPELKSIDIQDEIEVSYGDISYAVISLLPRSAAVGKIITLDNSAEAIAVTDSNEYVLDANGQAIIAIKGLLPGITSIKFHIEGFDISAITTIKVTTEMVQTSDPFASVPSGEITKGTKVYLSCPEPDAVIYFTTNGGCPCDENIAAVYDGNPIVIEDDITLKIMAKAPNKYDSNVIEYSYSVNNSSVERIQLDEEFAIYPLPLGEYLTISNGDFIIDSVSIYNINGELMLYSGMPQKQVTLKVGHLNSGVYILNVKTNGSSVVNKVIKR